MTDQPLPSAVDRSTAFGTACLPTVLFYEEVDSTNAVATHLAALGAASGTVAVAAVQRHGRGRFQRTWESPSGGLYLSILIRPPSSSPLTLLPLLAALAVARTLGQIHADVTIRWPNDVLASDKKVAGILLESSLEGASARVVIGIGINLNTDMESLSPEVRAQATSLADLTGRPLDLDGTLRALLVTFDELYESFLGADYDDIRTQWRSLADTLGRHVSIQLADRTVEGLAVDIDANGFLQVKTEAGTVETITSGDCRYLR